MAPGYFRSRLYQEYYKAISKNLIHFESCYKIFQDIGYLKDFINHLSGYVGYAWFTIDANGQEVDLGKNIFKNGARGQLENLIKKVKEVDTTYIAPEVQYGDYFELPRRRNVVLQNYRRQNWAIFGIISIFCVIMFLVYTTVAMPWWVATGLILYTFLLGGVFHPFKQKISVAEMAAKWLIKKINK